MSAFPWHPDVERLVTDSPTYSVTAVAVTATSGTIPLELTSWEIEWDERRSPRTTARLECAIPDDPDTIAALDPRTAVTIALSCGIVLEDGTDDSHYVAPSLILTERTIDRPASTMTLTASGLEAVLIGSASPLNDGTSNPFLTDPFTYANGIIDSLLTGTPWADPLVIRTAAEHPDVWASYGDDYWNALEDVLDACDWDLYDNGDGVIRIADRPIRAAGTAAVLRSGYRGTLLGSSSTISREDFANYVVVRYRGTADGTLDGTPVNRYGWAKLASGTYGPAAAGWRMKLEERDGNPNAAQAHVVATSLLRRWVSRSRTTTLEAVAMPWIRPGHTVTVQLPTGAQERHIVSRVRLTPPTMTIATRRPETLTITAGE